VTAPYYSDNMVTIYHGRCEDIVPDLGRFDLLLTDPPYGIGASGRRDETYRGSKAKHNRKEHVDYGWDDDRPVLALRIAMRSASHHVIWGGSYYPALLDSRQGWLVWDKGQDLSQSDCELAYTSFDSAVRRIVVNRFEIAQEGACHPTQKPVRVMTFALKYAMDRADISTVLDPFMGSGTTLVACRKAGIKCVGIDAEEKYCEIAVRRISQMGLFEVAA